MTTINERKWTVVMIVMLVNLFFTLSLGQCPIGTTMSFEKMASVIVEGVPQMPLFSGQNPVTAECNNRCRAGPKCRGFLINYARHSCVGMDSLKGARLVPTEEKTAFFEKICLSTVPCEKAWTFERIDGRHLHGFDSRVFPGVVSRLSCQELCLKERQFVCRSGEYDASLHECRLSVDDRRTQPLAFRHSTASVEYFENQCARAAECDYEKHNNVNVMRADLIRTAFTVEQCRSLCDATRAFICRSFTFIVETAQCWLSSDDSHDQSLEPHAGAVYFQRSSCIDLQLSCHSDSMIVSLNTVEPFSGKIYSKDDPMGCESIGRSTTMTSLKLPFQSKCGIREENGKYSSLIVVQYHPLIQRKNDRIIQLMCHFEMTNKTITNSYNVIAENPPIGETAIVNATAQSPNIHLRITDRVGNDVIGARLGDELFLRIELDDDSVYGIFARDLIAKSGKTDESIVLIDGNGCPTDFAIFPSFEKLTRNKSLAGKFDAFKFADDIVVRFQVNVQFCIQECFPIDCNATNKSFGRRKRRSTIDSLDYPLQREIIVEGMTMKSARTPNTELYNHGIVSMFCTSRATLLSGLVTIVTLQLTVLGTCCACLFIYKRPLCGQKVSSKDSVTESSVSNRHALWSVVSRIE